MSHLDRQAIRVLLFSVLALLSSTAPLFAQRFVIADGVTDTYTLINSTLGGNAIESPDCIHPEFGPHITQAFDSDLGKASFIFHMHVTPDNDRCVAFDRQRNEIKTYGPSPDYLKGFFGDSVTFRWRFKLDAGFQPSPNFTHIHQIKAGDGPDAGAPIITLTPRAGTPEALQIIHVDSGATSTVVASTELTPLKGIWVEAYETLTYSFNGTYSIELRDLGTGTLLLSYSSSNIDLWRNGTTFVRPKWGIYRSLLSQSYLRDETVRFDRFCLAKGVDDCPPSAPGGPDFSLAATPASQTVTAGAGTDYTVTVTPSGGFAGTVTFSVSGLPTGADGSFNPAAVSGAGSSTLSVTTSPGTPPDVYGLTITGTSGALVHTVTVTLGVQAADGSDFSLRELEPDRCVAETAGGAPRRGVKLDLRPFRFGQAQEYEDGAVERPYFFGGE